MKIRGKHYSRIAFILSVILLIFFPCRVTSQITPLSATSSTAKSHYELAITDINLIDGTGKKLQEGVNIYIKDGRISEIVKDRLQTTVDTVINGTGKYAIPGLFDAHYHFIDYRERDLENYKEQGKYLIHFGITNVLVTNGIIEDLQKFRRLIDNGTAMGPRIFYTSRTATIPGAHPAKGENKSHYTEQENIEYVNDTLDIKRIVKTANEEGAVAIKIIVEDGPTPPLVERMPAKFIQGFSREAEKYDLPVFAHISDMEEVRIAVANGITALMHGAQVQLPEDMETLEEINNKDVSWVFTNMIPKSMIFYPLNHQWLEQEPYKVFDEEYLSSLTDPDGIKAERSKQILLNYFKFDSLPSFETFIKETMNFNNEIFQKGVNIAVGTDTGGPSPYILPGVSVHEEMEMLQISGIAPIEIIKMASLNAAKMIGKSKSLGSVEKGKVADLVVLDKNPLENIINTLSVSTVIKEGKIQDRLE